MTKKIVIIIQRLIRRKMKIPKGKKRGKRKKLFSHFHKFTRSFSRILVELGSSHSSTDGKIAVKLLLTINYFFNYYYYLIRVLTSGEMGIETLRDFSVFFFFFLTHTGISSSEKFELTPQNKLMRRAPPATG